MAKLGGLALPAIAEDYRDENLESQVHELHPILYSIIAGNPDEGGRLEAFLQGGKTRRLLAQKVGTGSFHRGEYGLINSLLQSEFLPDLASTKNPSPPKAEGIPMKRDGDVTQDFTDILRLHFVTDVLLPETITQLTMRRSNVSYTEAHEQILECKRDEKTDMWWVDDILAARESFLNGQKMHQIN